MKTNSQKTNKTWMSAAIGFALLLLFAAPQRVVAQWTTSGNNISNTNTGNVGIGTTTRGRKLEILATDGEAIRLYRNGNYVGWGVNMKFAFNNSNNAQIDYAGVHGVVQDNAAGAERGILLFTTANSGSLTEKMRIDASGNIGIGTATPFSNAKLQVRPGTDQNFAVMGPVTMADGIVLNSFNDAVNANKSMELRASAFDFTLGNVGIGTASPAVQLHLVNTSTAQARIESTGAAAAVADFKNSSRRWVIGTGILSAAGDFSIYDANTAATRVFVDTSGQVGIGTTTPAYKLDVNGTVNATGLNVNGSAITSSQWTTSGSNINYATSGGNVGVGQANPAYKLDVNGTAHVSGNMTVDGNLAAKYQDVAEWVPSSEQLPTGTVVVLDSTKSNQVIASSVSYDTRVAGVISEQPGIALGERGANKVLVATTGRVRVKVDATRGPIQVGDLLVTSDIPGMAMKSEPVNIGGIQLHRPGTLIGKALEPLSKGSGEILVLLSLQ